MKEFEFKRKKLVEELVANSSIQSEEVKNAFLKVKRETFFPESKKECVYIDSAFPIGFGQTISQPTTIAIMLELLDAKNGMNVLEVGAGCGYVLALLSEIAGEKGKVYGIELVKELVEIAKKNIEIEGCKNVEMFFGDGTHGLKEKAPFDRIIISAASNEISKKLIEQLKENGKLAAPIGGKFLQKIVLVKKEKNKAKIEKEIEGFVFVPLINTKKVQ